VPQFGYLVTPPASDEPQRLARKTLRLTATGAAGADDRTHVVVHDVSETGLLLESPFELAQGEELDVILPRLGEKRVTVAWASGRFFGCQFADTAAPESDGVAAPSGMDALPGKGSPEAVSLASVQLHELSMAIERIGRILDRAMDQLSKRER
jgi:hypothetical protein